MTLWLDNQLPPALVPWVRSTLLVECVAVRELNLHQHGPPPQVVLATHRVRRRRRRANATDRY